MARSPKYDYLTQLVGRGVERTNPRQRRGRGESFHKTITVTSHQASALNQYIIQENRYYNLLIDFLQPRLKNSPEFYLELSEEQINLFPALAFHCFDIRSLVGKKSADTELPKKLEPYRNILFGIHGDKEIGISERLSIFYEGLRHGAGFWPHTRANMAYELLDFCLKQAKTMTSGRRTSFSGEEGDCYYGVNPEILETANLMQKRHLQLLKKDVQVKWDEKNDRSLIKIPYFERPIIIETINIPEQYPFWNLIIIHQDPQEIILTKAIWEIDFKSTMSRYLIKYLEQVNPDSKMKSRHVRRR